MSACDGLAREDQLLAMIPLVCCPGHRLRETKTGLLVGILDDVNAG
jgi:hypothetical protein